jgi:hypothetical protein
MADFRVFLSAVTSEFGTARDALAADLRSRDTLVRVQSDFRQEADTDTTLKKLHEYIPTAARRSASSARAVDRMELAIFH